MISYSGAEFSLKTERLVLRPFVAADVAPFAALNADAEVMRWLGGPRSLEKTLAQMQHANGTLASDGFGKVAMERRSDGAFLGMCGFSIEEWYSTEFLEIGWRLAPEFQGRGFVTEAGKAWLDYGFETLGLDRVISIADVPNLASIAVMKRLGMNFYEEAELEVEGERFAAVVYEMRVTEWRNLTRV